MTSASEKPVSESSKELASKLSRKLTEKSSYSPAQIRVWLRGLLTVAWADGQFEDAEKQMIQFMVESEFAPCTDFDSLEPIEPAELAEELKLDNAAAQNFLRMAVMVALANGVYSEAEDNQVMAFAKALSIEHEAFNALRTTLQKLRLLDGKTVIDERETATDKKGSIAKNLGLPKIGAKVSKAVTDVEPLKPAREWLDQLSMDDPRLARFVCKLVPSQCPFERDVTLFGKKVVHIPPMCKINPLYEQLVGLRFRALTYLADDCGEDISSYV